MLGLASSSNSRRGPRRSAASPAAGHRVGQLANPPQTQLITPATAVATHPYRLQRRDPGYRGGKRFESTADHPDVSEPPGDDQHRRLTRVVGQLGWSVSLYTLRKYGAGDPFLHSRRIRAAQGPLKKAEPSDFNDRGDAVALIE